MIEITYYFDKLHVHIVFPFIYILLNVVFNKIVDFIFGKLKIINFSLIQTNTLSRTLESTKFFAISSIISFSSFFFVEIKSI